MSVFRIQYTHRARQDLRKFPREVAQKTIRALEKISGDPYLQVKKLKGTDPKHPVYSFRVMRDVRAILSIHNDILVVHVLEIEHRKHAYRDF